MNTDHHLAFLGIATGETGSRCVVCGRNIDSDNYHVDRYNRRACTCHNVQCCCFCGRIIGNDAVDVPYFGTACGRCGSERSYDELETIRTFCYSFFASHKLYLPAVRICLLSAEEMQLAHGSPEGTPRGVASRNSSGYRIDLMRQLSRIGMAKTLAHELAHLWQWHRNIDAPHTYCEGFCNLVASLVFSQISKTEALVILHQMMENPDPAYGAAFRELKIVYDIHGWQTLIEAMKTFQDRS